MLWDRINQLKELFSLLFVIAFSISSLIWNSNFVSSSIVGTQRVSNIVFSSIDSIGTFLKGSFNKLETYESVRTQRDSYQKLIEEFKNLPQDIERLKNENESLRKELNFQPSKIYPYIKAEVLSVRLNTIYRTIVINKGKDEGLMPYMPVVARAIDEKGNVIQAIVGKVIAVSSTTSIVQPLVNSGFTMGVKIPGTDIWATLSGNSGKSIDVLLSYIETDVFNTTKSTEVSTKKENVKKEGSAVGKPVYSTSGSGLFPGDIPVGIIVEEGAMSGIFKIAYVKPYVKFEELQFVTVIKKLPDKWREEWPTEQKVEIEDPFFGELNNPDEIPQEELDKKEEPEKEKPKEKNQTIKKVDDSKKTKSQTKVKKKKQMPTESDDDDDVPPKVDR